MFLGLLTLLTALVISSVAVYYSVSGLAAIFAGASVPIIIMGASLEVGKLVTASWLHKNWKTAPFALKTYLSTATIILMFITSMGIFGFLSRAHIEQGAPVGDVQAKIELIDEKISAKRTEIEQARTALKNLDDVVAQFMAKGKDEKSVAAANNARKSQQAERNKTAKVIDDAQKEISKLQEQKMPFAQQVRKIESEVGPIKYIAQFIYGDTSNRDMLEKAVTWMILIIIFVFDPLAVLLLIASQISFNMWSESRKAKQEVKIVEPEPIKQEPIIQTVVPPIPPTFEEVIQKLDERAKDIPAPEEKKDDPIIEPKRAVEDSNSNSIPEPIVDVDPVVPQPTPVAEDVDDWNKMVEAAEQAPAEEKIAKEPKIKKKESYVMKQGDQQILRPKKDL
jgi:hypothetical protein